MANKRFEEAKAYTYVQLCNQYEKFRIPPFQRAYAWRPKQINELWDSIITNDEEYFIGNLVCLSPTEDDDRLIIIDGQQRLTTILLFLAAIRDEYKKIRLSKKEDLHIRDDAIIEINELLYFKERRSYPVKKSLRLQPGKANLANVYEQILEAEIDYCNSGYLKELDDGQKKYARNYKIISNLIHKHIKDSKRPINELSELESKVESLLAIVIVCASDSDAYQIFEGLNATGVGLSVADLVKNSVMQSAKGFETKNEIEDIWEQIELIFEKTRTSLFPKFLRHQWISCEGYITTSKLFDEIKKQKLKDKDRDSILKYAKKLLDDARAYIAFREPDFDNYITGKISKKAVSIIDRFRFLDLDQVYELILSYYNKKISVKDYSNKQFENDLEKLWIFSFRARLISLNPSEYEKKFADHCKYVSKYNKKEMQRMSEQFYLDLSKLVKKDQVFIENFVTDLKYTNDNRLIRYILTEIMHNEQRSISVNEPTIEHILPQEPSTWGLKLSTVEEYVHNIGNLTILNDLDNKTLQNSPLDIKISKVFSKSDFRLNQRIINYQKSFKINPRNAISERGRELAEAANDIWNNNLKNNN